MNTRITPLVVSVVLFGAPLPSMAQLAPNAPPDKPLSATESQARRVMEAIAPYVDQARKTYPKVKERYIRGLLKGETLFVTARLSELSGRFELVFLRVGKLADGRITGWIASDVRLVKGYKEGDPYTLREAELFDWTIAKSDGSEEGNLVGKFLETCRP